MTVAPTDDPSIGVIGRTGEVFFKPVPNDGTASNYDDGKSAFAINVSVPETSGYQISLTVRLGSEEFGVATDGSACSTSCTGSSCGESVLLCANDPRGSPHNPAATADPWGDGRCQYYSSPSSSSSPSTTSGRRLARSEELAAETRSPDASPGLAAFSTQSSRTTEQDAEIDASEDGLSRMPGRRLWHLPDENHTGTIEKELLDSAQPENRRSSY